MNQTVREDSSSGFKGVNQDPRNGSWRAFIAKENKTFYLGSYITKEISAYVYNVAAIILFGEFAVLNIVPNPIEGCDKIQYRVKHIILGRGNPNKSRSFLKPSNDTTSGYIGVTFRKDCNRWRASINLEKGKTFYIGSETSSEEAAYLYNLAARELKGVDFDLNDVELSEEKKVALQCKWDKKCILLKDRRQ